MSGFQDPLNTWNQRFAQDGYLFGEHPNQYLVQQAAHLRPGRALAVADGEGRNGVWLAEQGLTVDAFDFSPVALDKARALAQAGHRDDGVAVLRELLKTMPGHPPAQQLLEELSK